MKLGFFLFAIPPGALMGYVLGHMFLDGMLNWPVLTLAGAAAVGVMIHGAVRG